MKAKLCRAVRWDCFKSFFTSIFLYAFGSLTEQFIMIYSAFVLGEFVNLIMDGNAQFGMEHLKVIAVCVGISVVIPVLLTTAGEISMFGASVSLSRKVLERYLQKDCEAAHRINESEIQYRLEDDVIGLGCSWVEMGQAAILLPLVTAYLLYHSFSISVWFTVVVFGISLFKLVVPIAVKKLLAEFDLKEREYQTKFRVMESNMIRNPCEIRLYGLYHTLSERLKAEFLHYAEGFYVRKTRFETGTRQVLDGLNTFCILLILFIGAAAVSAGSLSVGAIAAMAGYFYVFNMIIEYADCIVRSFPVYKNLEERISWFYEDGEKKEGVHIGTVTEIEMENLGFSYDGKEIFSNVSEKIGPNAKTAVCGVNGSGKSTLLKILCGFYHSYSGKITINGHNMKDIALDSFRKQCAYVEQSPYLFKGSVRENIRLGNLKASEEEVDAVMRQVGISELAEREIGGNQTELSGGECKKIAIARAILRKCSVLFLDEPGNNLDAKTNAWLEQFIREFHGMIFFVSHEQDSIAGADNVIVLK